MATKRYGDMAGNPDWPEAINAIYRKHLVVAGEDAMHYGPAHIVWDDHNFDRGCVQWCLDNFDTYSAGHAFSELLAVRQSLLDLLALSDDVLDWCSDDDAEVE